MKNVLLILLVAAASLVFSKEGDKKIGWHKEGIASLSLTQTRFDNYVQGGEDTFSWQTNIAFQFNNTQENWKWSNSGRLRYGRNKIGDEPSIKSIDEIKLETVYTQVVNKYVNPYASATGETQITAGYEYYEDSKEQISDFMDPAFFREAIGVNYTANEIVKARVGLSAKQTITSDFPQPFADDPDTEEIEKIRTEYGMESVVDVHYKISKTSLLVSKLEIFSNLKAFDEIDVKWDTDLTAELTQFISFNFNFLLLYDKTISPKRQIKEVMGIGITYSFF